MYKKDLFGGEMDFIDKIIESGTDADRRYLQYYDVVDKIAAIKRLRSFIYAIERSKNKLQKNSKTHKVLDSEIKDILKQNPKTLVKS